MNQALIDNIIDDKKKGHSDETIGKKYGVNAKLIEKAITKHLGVNVSNINQKDKKITELSPKSFIPANTTVWSFKSRGSWATHNGNYRGNWSPYIPRNIILRYSKENDLVLDYFCGSGTTAVECKLLNRNFIGLDINPEAIKLAKENIDFETNNIFNSPEITLKVGDARDLSNVDSNSIDLICAHPPYADIVQYTENNQNDLSHKNVDDFLCEIAKVANESYRVLKDEHYCSILIGDMRKNKNVIPLGFWTIEKYIEAGFEIKELIIKRQHNCKTTGFWKDNSIKYNFLLLAHEYLVVFKKTKKIDKLFEEVALYSPKTKYSEKTDLESTSVWIFDKKTWLNNTLSNLIKRYSSNDYLIYRNDETTKKNPDLIINFNENFDSCIKYAKDNLKENGILAVMCEDYRNNEDNIESRALSIEKKLRNDNQLKIKELIVVSIENGELESKEDLYITHKYLLIYKKV